MNTSNILTEFLVRSGKQTTSGWIDDTKLYNWLSMAHRWASGYKPWPFSEGRVSTTFATGAGSDSDEWIFEGIKADSIRIATVAGERLRKLNFDDYLIFKEEESDSSEKVCSDYGNIFYVNPNIGLSGTLVVYGQYIPANFDSTDGSENTVFTSTADDGNQAVIEEMIAYAYKRDGKRQEAINQHLLAKQILDELWQKVLNEQHAYQSHKDRGGMFQRIDVINGEGVEDNFFNENQF